MARDGRQDVVEVRTVLSSSSEPAEALRESDLLKSLRKQNHALDQLRQALDDDLFGPDEVASIERDRLEAGLAI